MPSSRTLKGRFAAHQRFRVARQLAEMDFLAESIAEVRAEIAERVCSLTEEIAHLDMTPGVNRRIADASVAQVRTDLSRFPRTEQLAV